MNEGKSYYYKFYRKRMKNVILNESLFYRKKDNIVRYIFAYLIDTPKGFKTIALTDIKLEEIK